MLTEGDVSGLKRVFAIKLADHIFSVPLCKPGYSSGVEAGTQRSPLKGSTVKGVTILQQNQVLHSKSFQQGKNSFNKNSMKS